MKKKILSVVLCITMLLSIFSIVPMSVSAESAETEEVVDQFDDDYEYQILSDGTVEITGYYGDGGDVTIPTTLDGYSVTSIGVKAFYNCTSLASITIPDSVTSIGDRAFKYCTSLTSVTIGNGVTSISKEAFYYCTSLKEINVSSDNSKYSSQDGVLFNKDKTELILYPAGKTDTSYAIPNSVTSIGSEAFYDCTSLKSVTIPNSVTSIGGGAFDNTAWYDNQPDGLVYAGKVAYKYKGEMTEGTSITLKDGTVSIADYAFYNCTSLTSVTIPDSVTSIGSDAFEYSSLASVTIGNGVTSIGENAFYYCTSLESITIPNSVTSIGDSAFEDCRGLTSVIIGNSVTSIGFRAFFRCDSLTSITIPNSVTSIGEEAFGYNYRGKTDGFTIYGTKGSEAERYANDNEFIFVEVDKHIDKDTKIEVDVAGDVTLNVEKPSKQEESKIKELLDKNENLIVAHDITLLKDKTPVQPESIATVKIPTPIGVDGKNCKIYRINDDNTKTDMNAKYEDGYMVFNTDHFSLYALVSTSSVLLGDADMDGEITIIDATFIQKYLAKLIDESQIDLSVCDVDKDGEVSVMDATCIQKYLAGIIKEL